MKKGFGLLFGAVLMSAVQPVLASSGYRAYTEGVGTSTPRSAVYTDPQSAADEACQNQAAAANASGRNDFACVSIAIDPEYCSPATGECWHVMTMYNAAGTDVNGRFWNRMRVIVWKNWYTYYLRLDDPKTQCDDRTACGLSCSVPTVGNPISTLAANKIQVETEVGVSPDGKPGITRYYNSRARQSPPSVADGFLGFGWRHAYTASLSPERMHFSAGRPASDPQTSGLYADAGTACVSGWSELSGRLGNALPAGTVTAAYVAGRCELSVNGRFWRFANVYETNNLGRPDLASANILAWKRIGRDGRVMRFVPGGEPDLWVSLTKTDGVLRKTGNVLVYTGTDGSAEYYDLSGRLQTLEERSGFRQTLTYDADGRLIRVDASTGAYLLFGYLPDGRLGNIEDHTGRRWQYRYDGNGRLSRVVAPDGSERQYLYEDARHPNALTGIIDERGVRYATWRYDADGRAILSEHAGGAGRVTLVFPDRWTTVATNSLGVETTYRFTTPNGVARLAEVAGPGCRACTSPDSRYEYDAAGNLVRQTENGQTTEYGDYDANGNPGYRIEGAGTADARRIDYTYDPRFLHKVATRTEPSVSPGRQKVTTWTYDDFGNLTRLQIDGFEPDGTPVSRSYTLQYNGPYHQLTQIDGPRTDVADITTLEYYPDDPAEGPNRARLRRVSVAGQVVRDAIAYTATGKVAQEARPNGLTLRYTYHPGSDRLATVTESDGTSRRTTRWTYLPTGEVETVTLADGLPEATTLRFGYDEAGVWSRSPTAKATGWNTASTPKATAPANGGWTATAPSTAVSPASTTSTTDSRA